ncbi:lipopolysaccharide biosynthesis protein [Ammoniphilus sp. CFH 90114]|uniref:lipopolysaccharide biosynthesis protein n=1 Tax=Ammoniphilus sp. CFH 90114 TaxID=2493665 RepID=UPI00100FAB91|nr:lipopolysaccharide biosynthesis protein [Ammoniphilus sp. CFH 90114]RXT03670.1 lipopolysaccharide biosynthesis protein [Ammoniphilus sp. CFH 90114]
MVSNLNSKIINAAKWSTITSTISKLITPITTMILARILTPEAFGVIATVTMIISFADMFADAGFQKYLIQQDFKNNKIKFRYANVAFWTNLTISFLIWLLISIFSEQIATFAGNPGLGKVIVIAGISLPLTSFSSIQMALYRRSFDFKTLFYVKLFGICIPFFVTIPLALYGLSYWSIIIGTICGSLSNAIILTIKSEWKPTAFYSFMMLKKMFSFSFWSLLETISIWFTSWVDIFIISSLLNSYYLGIYKTSINMVNGILGLVAGSIATVLFSALSRLKDNENSFNETLFKFQKYVSIFLLPMGVGIFIYRDTITYILLGSQWAEASLLIGLWGLINSSSIVFSYLSSEVYRSKGLPKISLLAQLLHIIAIIPTCYISMKYGFNTLVIARSLIGLQFVLVHFLLLYMIFKISPLKMIKNIFPIIFCSALMGLFAELIQMVSNKIYWNVVSIGLCIVFYFMIILLIPSIRMEIFEVLKKKSQKLNL